MASNSTNQEVVFGYIIGDRDGRVGVEKVVKYVNSGSDLLPIGARHDFEGVHVKGFQNSGAI